MIRAGIAEYVLLITGMGGFSIAGFELTLPVIAVVAGILFLFWLVVFRW